MYCWNGLAHYLEARLCQKCLSHPKPTLLPLLPLNPPSLSVEQVRGNVQRLSENGLRLQDAFHHLKGQLAGRVRPINLSWISLPRAVPAGPQSLLASQFNSSSIFTHFTSFSITTLALHITQTTRTNHQPIPVHIPPSHHCPSPLHWNVPRNVPPKLAPSLATLPSHVPQLGGSRWLLSCVQNHGMFWSDGAWGGCCQFAQIHSLHPLWPKFGLKGDTIQ